MTSAHVRDPLSDHLLTLQNAAFLSMESLSAGSSAPTCAAAPPAPSTTACWQKNQRNRPVRPLSPLTPGATAGPWRLPPHADSV
jgi:hypothetical protein